MTRRIRLSGLGGSSSAQPVESMTAGGGAGAGTGAGNRAEPVDDAAAAPTAGVAPNREGLADIPLGDPATGP